MENTFDIYFSDLTPAAQKELLRAARLKNPEDANWGIFPITTVGFYFEDEEF